MYTISQASQRTGISIPTIRMWERRYGVVAPTRTPSGYRLYDEESIARLDAMQHLVEREGWRPSQAAERIRRAAPGELLELGAAGRTTDAPRQVTGPPVDDMVESIVDAARRLDVRSIDATLDETFAAQRFEAAMEAVVFPALREIGDAWARGELDVAREHAASETIRRRIAHYFDAASRSAAGPTVVIGLPPGSRHELGAFAFAVAARRAGLDVVYLGADVPLVAWRRAVLDADAKAAVIAVVGRDDVRRASETISGLQQDAIQRIAVGGPSASAISSDVGAIHLPDAIDEAVERLRELIDASPQ